jgi:hypothetical protein
VLRAESFAANLREWFVDVTCTVSDVAESNHNLEKKNKYLQQVRLCGFNCLSMRVCACFCMEKVVQSS